MEERIKELEGMICGMAEILSKTLTRLSELEAKVNVPADPCMVQIGHVVPTGGYWDLILTGNNPDELQVMLLNIMAHSNMIKDK